MRERLELARQDEAGGGQECGLLACLFLAEGLCVERSYWGSGQGQLLLRWCQLRVLRMKGRIAHSSFARCLFFVGWGGVKTQEL